MAVRREDGNDAFTGSSEVGDIGVEVIGTLDNRFEEHIGALCSATARLCQVCNSALPNPVKQLN